MVLIPVSRIAGHDRVTASRLWRSRIPVNQRETPRLHTASHLQASRFSRYKPCHGTEAPCSPQPGRDQRWSTCTGSDSHHGMSILGAQGSVRFRYEVDSDNIQRMALLRSRSAVFSVHVCDPGHYKNHLVTL